MIGGIIVATWIGFYPYLIIPPYFDKFNACNSQRRIAARNRRIYASPIQTMSDFFHRPATIRLVNRLGGLIHQTGFLPFSLDRDKILQQAQRKIGLHDFGPDDFMEPLGRLLHSYQHDARLNFIGLACAHVYLLRLLVNRLRMEQDRAKHPLIASEKIAAPVFILGLPRTGSTILFELLATDPRFRVPASWEVMFPSPAPGFDEEIASRIRTTDRMLNWVDRLSPEFKKIHPLGALLPQECITILAQAFRSVQFHTQNDVPSYQRWLDDADMLPAYAYHERFLQQLQHRTMEGKRWLLKAPVHLFALDSLFSVYPDATIIQTHRDPAAVVSSVSSFSATIRQSFSESLDLKKIGETSCGLWVNGLSRSINFRESHPEHRERFFDLYYQDFIKDPIASLDGLYRHIGIPYGDDQKARAQNYLDIHPQNRHGRHSYTLESFHLSKASVRQQFSQYLDYFQLF